jgi:hypothetical protein
MELDGWQRVYDNYVLYQDRLPSEVRKQLFKSSAHVAWPFPAQGEEGREEQLKPIVAELNRGLENLGLKIEAATCTCASGPTLVRFVAAEQEIVEHAVVSGGGSREGGGLT